MNDFLIWCVPRQATGTAPAPQVVADRFCEALGPLFAGGAAALKQAVRTDAIGPLHVLFLEHDVEGLRIASRDRRGDRRTYAFDLPQNILAFVPRGDSAPLTRLSHRLEEAPLDTLQGLVAPFSMLWMDAERERAVLQTDALGYAQVYHHAGGELQAWSSRILAFRALGLPLEPVPEQWAYRLTTNSFPEDSSGIRHVAKLSPGQQVVFDREGAREHQVDTLGWLFGEPHDSLSLNKGMERAAAILLETMSATAALAEELRCPLSGGFDTRPMAAALHHLDLPHQLWVEGTDDRPDVQVATSLARRLGRPIEVVGRSVLVPPEDPEQVVANTVAALRWQLGHGSYERYKSFQRGGQGFPARVRHGLNGKYGYSLRYQYGREFYGQPYGSATTRPPSTASLDSFLLEHLAAGIPAHVQPTLEQAVRERLAAQVAATGAAGDDPLRRGTHFAVLQEERKQAAADGNWNTDLRLCPYGSPQLLRTVLRIDPRATASPDFDVVCRQLVARFAPAWENEPFLRDLGEPTYSFSKNNPYYDRLPYWRELWDTEPLRRRRERSAFLAAVCDLGALAGNEPAVFADDLLILSCVEEAIGGR